MTKIIFSVSLLFSITSYSQEVTDSIRTSELGEIKLETLRYSDSQKKTSQQILSISQKDIEFGNFQTTAEMLSNSGKVAVQKSQQGGGSPIIRGLESNRILLLVDGIRMNNLIYRGGHLQNIITVDENMLENADVLFGSSSTAYGSDAMGGAINLVTKRPHLLSEDNHKKFYGNSNTRYGTVNKEKSAYGDFGFSGQHWATLTAFSYNDFGDLKMGSKKNGNNPFFGSRPFYVETINGEDNIVANPNPLVQKYSGYTQYNAMQKVLYQPNETTQHSLNLQYSTTSDIPRYDRLTDIRGGNLRFATWNYGPQKRVLTGYKFSKEKAVLNSDLSIGLSFQDIEESRINRNRNNANEETRLEKVNVYSLNIDLKAKLGRGELLYGFDGFYDDLNSSSSLKNVKTGTITSNGISSRYPNGKNYNYKADVFATYYINLNKKTSFNIGARGGYNKLFSEFSDKTFFPFPYSNVEQDNITYSGAIGINKTATNNLKFAINLSSGFRTPNIDDLAKVFESAAGSSTSSGSLIVPNPNLKPEKNVTADLTAILFENKNFEFENTVFYTQLFDVIATSTFAFNEQNTVIYDGYPATVLANQNLGKADVFGFSSSLKFKIIKDLKFHGTYNFTQGRIIDGENKGRPLDHIPPFYGKAGFNYDGKWVNLDLNITYNGKKHLKDYSNSGEDNLQYAPSNGMPSWQTYNFKAALKPFKSLTLFTGIENILDTQYRFFASGINAPGRNFYGGAKVSI